MICVNMDFCYACIALLLFFHGSIGQDAAETTPAESPVSLEIAVSPYGTQHSLDLGKPKTFTCKVTTDASETPVITWKREGEEITDANPSSRVYIKASGNKLQLKFTDIQDDDSGSYECVASLGGKEVSSPINLEVKMPIKILSEENQHGIVNSDATVKCKATGRPLPEVSWSFVNGSDIVDIQSNDKFVVTQNEGLVIKNLQFSDQRLYTCEAFVEASGDSETLVVDFLVVELPKIDLPPTIEPANPKVGDKVTIFCKANGKPKPTYSFTKNGQKIPDDQIDAVAGTLTIEDLKREDEAEYNCIASNQGGSDEKANSLDVQIPPTITPIADIEEAVEKQDMKIECVAEGDPAPQVTWRKQGMDTEYTTSQDHPKITIEDINDVNDEIKTVKSIMKFDGLQAADAGTYICTANSVSGTDVKEVKMAVKYSPHFDTPFTQTVFYGWPAHTANLTCQANGNPNPLIEWERKLPGGDDAAWQKIEPQGPFMLGTLRTSDHLSMRDLFVTLGADDLSLYGEYRCVAANTVGTPQTKTVEMKQASAPGAPTMSIGKTMSTKFTLNVQKPTVNGGLPVTRFAYTYYIDAEDRQEKNGEEGVAGDNTLITLEDLKPNTTYVVNMAAKNEIGAGTEASLLVTTKTVSAPLKLSIQSVPQGSAATEYNLKWAEPDDGGAAIERFEIRYKQVTVTNPDKDPSEWQTASDVDKEFTILKVRGSRARSHELVGLKRDSFYEVRLTAINSKGASSPDVQIIQTGKGNVTEAEGAETGTDNSSSSGGEDGADGSSMKKSSASAGLGSGLVIAIIVIIIIVLIAVVAIAVLVVKRRKAARGGDAEGGKAEDGKAAAEEEKLIQKDNTKVENENDKGDGIEEKQEFEPDQKPDPAPESDVADAKPAEDAPTEPTIQITPETPDKPENPEA